MRVCSPLRAFLRIEYDTVPTFANFHTLPFIATAGGQPFVKEIPSLLRGVVYYVRVRAQNSQGTGAFTIPTPASEYPRELPTAPTNVRVGVTSGRVGDGKLTVAWDMPTCDGGAPVTAFHVKWDVDPMFRSLELLPNKGDVSVLVSASMSHTISNLTPGRAYTISVAAVNSVGERFIATAVSATPSLRT